MLCALTVTIYFTFENAAHFHDPYYSTIEVLYFVHHAYEYPFFKQ